MTRPQSIPDPDGAELAAAMFDKITDIRRRYAELLDDIAEMNRRQMAKEAGYPSLQAYLVHATRMSRRNANRLVAQAEQITEILTRPGMSLRRHYQRCGNWCAKARWTVIMSMPSPPP